MSEDIKKETQNAQLDTENLAHVNGGSIFPCDNPQHFTVLCTKCGAEMINKNGGYICPNGCKSN